MGRETDGTPSHLATGTTSPSDRHHGQVRPRASILHVDLDAFFASVEQRDKPSLAGRPVVVGGLGPRGVVATASYEARRHGVGSAMPMAMARVRCPHAAFLAPRFEAYQATSRIVMQVLHALSALVEPLSLDEAFVDVSHLLTTAPDPGPPASCGSGPSVTESSLATLIRQLIHEHTGLSASVGAGTSKLIAKIASDLAKPDGQRVVPPGEEQRFLDPLPVRRVWGVGPATADRLARLGVGTVVDLRRLDEAKLVDLLGRAHGGELYRLARGLDDRPVQPERASKSVSVEDTFAQDITDPQMLRARLDAMAWQVAGRLRRTGLAGRTITLKVRRYDFATQTRSTTLRDPTDASDVLSRQARRLLDEVDTTDGARLLGLGVSGLSDWTQQELFTGSASCSPDATGNPDDIGTLGEPGGAAPFGPPAGTGVADLTDRQWRTGQDVAHSHWGRGWVWGAGAGRVTVRFEACGSPPGRVRTLGAGDPDLSPAGPQPYPPRTHTSAGGVLRPPTPHPTTPVEPEENDVTDTTTGTTTVPSMPRIGETAPQFEALSTHGPIKLSDYRGTWVVLFSHPADFTPVCTTEFMGFAETAPEFDKRGVALIGNSVDSVYSHLGWTRSIEEKTGVRVPFPIIADLDMKVAHAYGMIHPAMGNTSAVRAVFVIDPRQVVRAIIYYPMSAGRMISEILRLVDSLQLTDAASVSTPANWTPGDPVIVPAPATQDQLDARMKETGIERTDWYLSTKKL